MTRGIGSWKAFGGHSRFDEKQKTSEEEGKDKL
jgi:hypothetical protein